MRDPINVGTPKRTVRSIRCAVAWYAISGHRASPLAPEITNVTFDVISYPVMGYTTARLAGENFQHLARRGMAVQLRLLEDWHAVA